MVTTIELAELSPRLVLDVADGALPGKSSKGCTEPLVTGLFCGDAVMALTGFDDGGHGLSLGFVTGALAAGVALSWFAFASPVHDVTSGRRAA